MITSIPLDLNTIVIHTDEALALSALLTCTL